MPVDVRRLPRPIHWGLGAAAAGLALTLTGCGTGDADPTEPTSGSASASVSPTASGSGSASPSQSGTGDGGTATADDLPAVPLERSGYDGEPRPTDEVYHRACLEQLAGDAQVPETEGTGRDENGELSITPWSTQASTALTEGWRYCPTETTGGLAVPASFQVTPDGEDGSLSGLTIADAEGQQVGGFRADVSGGAPEGAKVVEVLEITEQPDFTGAGNESVYLRSLVVQSSAGAQLMVDLVSAPEPTDPQSLDVWDLAVHDGTRRDVVYGTSPLDSAEDAGAAADSELHAVLREMVGSYQPAVQ